MLQPSPGGLYLYGPDKFITSARFVQQAAIDRNLVGALEHDWVIFPIILGMSSSQLTKSIIFQRGCFTTNQSRKISPHSKSPESDLNDLGWAGGGCFNCRPLNLNKRVTKGLGARPWGSPAQLPLELE